MNDLNLENLKVGDEVVTIHPKDNSYGRISKIKEWQEGFKRFLLVSIEGKSVGAMPKDGAGYYFMSKREKPDFYYSANPEHIKKAKAIHKKANAEYERRKKREKKLFDQKKKLLDPILESYHDNEECYSFEFLSMDDLQKLSPQQIKTLVTWIKGK